MDVADNRQDNHDEGMMGAWKTREIGGSGVAFARLFRYEREPAIEINGRWRIMLDVDGVRLLPPRTTFGYCATIVTALEIATPRWKR